MKLAIVGSWLKDKLHALRGKEIKPQAPKKPIPPPRLGRLIKPWFLRNAVHPTAHCIARGRTLQPHAVAKAMHWRQDRIKALLTKVVNGTATRKEAKELRRIQS